ncbi:Transcriptional regulatory protein [Salinisphaera shabanensis E1L3A]|jgi:AcrR family transcriptional regulator|uniref:Transcriptional regulatory protein n=1 Tax=Salinisphaera shabanensis E1L3A TaxID=1033802 RepID=U2E8B3_9GAMM|nr:TetR/AcrR family transcriptional regulator [Salinisphaera shabanensis]ERJ19961.1 Transcriptional regulatory protein [Salinisphaera shabanensis E1L3A]
MMQRRMTKSQKVMLSANDWAEAALDAIGRRGVEGVAVEPIARELGVTKGSFYWHFPNREALLVAALQRWEARETDEVLDRVQQETDPRARVKRLITEVNTSKKASRIYSALSSATKPAFVRDYVERVSKRRLDFIIDSYAALGLSADNARRWALMTFSVFLGSLQIRRDLPEEWPNADEPAFAEYVRFLMVSLMPSELDAANNTPAPDVPEWPARSGGHGF